MRIGPQERPVGEDFRLNALTSGDFVEAEEPFALFGAWFEEAGKSEINDPNAMALATADADGMPDARMVLLKDWSPQGFVFYTNADSAKGRQLAANMQAALLFHWKSLRRQVRVRGPVPPVTDADKPPLGSRLTPPPPRVARVWTSSMSRRVHAACGRPSGPTHRPTA